MRMLGLMRVKNEGRWLRDSLMSQYMCDRVIVLDDNSTDNTPEICKYFHRVDYYRKTYDAGYEEGPDREWLAEQARKYNPDWICSLDGDEVLLDDTKKKLQNHLDNPAIQAIDVLSIHLWNDEQTVRVDGHFTNSWRQRFWRFPQGKISYAKDHCSLPNGIIGPFARLGIKLRHYGNLTAADRLRRYKTYGSQYPVMIQGDPGGPDVSEVLSGEPFRLAPLCTML
jgi:O-antigen biosynthesis protein